MQSYKVPARRANASITEKKSEFIAVCSPVKSEQEAVAFLEEVKATHRTARHNVYAYVLREGNRSRYSDDGEPAKTAGLPVLEVINYAGLTDCIVVVTRYFGGVLLGTGGLVRAYTTSAKAAVEAAGISIVRQCVNVSMQIEYPLYEQVRRAMETAGAKLEEPVFGQYVDMCCVLPVEGAESLVANLTELCRGVNNIQVTTPFYLPF